MDKLENDWDKIEIIITNAVLSKGLSLNIYGALESK